MKIRWSAHDHGRETSCHPRWAPGSSPSLRRSRSAPDESQKALLEKSEADEASSPSVLRGHLAVAAPAHRGSGHGDEALPEPRPEWIDICPIPHNEGVVNFPIVQDLPTLMWLINLGCIDLNQWYARCDDWDRPDVLHFDLDPGPGADFDRVREVALRVRDILSALKMPTYAKTTGSKGIHVYIPIVRGPLQKEVWAFAKAIAIELESRHPEIITAEYRKVKRPHGRVLVDYNQDRKSTRLN